jgi:zinc resistance-associated protein
MPEVASGNLWVPIPDPQSPTRPITIFLGKKRKINMLRTALVGLTALLIAGPALAQTQTPSERAQELLNSVDWKALTDARIDVVKTALQLTPEQEKLWPPVEQAIRARAEARHARLEAMAKPREEKRDVFEFLNDRADNMAKRAATLKQLAQAWQPLYQSLDDKQKMRLRVLAMHVLHEMRGAAESHMRGMEDDDAED